jgi:CDP-glucose 4,6-dehydratase
MYGYYPGKGNAPVFVGVGKCAMDFPNMTAFQQTYHQQKVLITGHTGFKGSWLSIWLHKMGANVVGVSKDIPTNPSMFEDLSLGDRIKSEWVDIRDRESLKAVISKEKPSFIFHLAAQAIVSQSYQNPIETIETNALGTANLLDALLDIRWPCNVVMITSDKCYENVEWPWGYRENDRLGGKDIYSASKACAEIVIRSYVESFFKKNQFVRVATARAGNVIGGGDWSKDRIVPDCIKSWALGIPVEIRSPEATRPWQHVLEPLGGYLSLGRALKESQKFHGESYNFGPKAEQAKKVIDLIDDLYKLFESKSKQLSYKITDNIPFSEAGLLKLNCDKALVDLHWSPTLNYEETIDFVGGWYKNYRSRDFEQYSFTVDQIAKFEKLLEQGQ